MKKLMSLFSSVLIATFFSVAQVNALETNKELIEPIYAACDGIDSDDPTDILSCNGRR